jgi:ferritin
MNTNKLSKTIAVAMNIQMTKEARASQVYLSHVVWGDKQNSVVSPIFFSDMLGKNGTI